MTTQVAEQLVQLDPAKVLADANIRFNLKQTSINSLADDILTSNGVLVPVEVETISPAQNGFTHRLTAGFYRHAALLKLNKEQKAGLTLPAIVRDTHDPVVRLRHQVSENMARESMSPMDQAIAADQLLKAGLSRMEVRTIFARPGGRKGLVVSPMSNAMLNITLRFLELPKAIQEKIHDGRVGVAAAYELGKVAPDKRDAVLKRAEAERESQMAKEEADEKKYLAAEKALTDAQVEERDAKGKVEEAKKAIEAAAEAVKAKQLALKEVRKAPFLELDAKGKKETTERLNASLADVKAAEKLQKEAKNSLAKILEQANKAAEKATEQKAKLDASRKPVKAAGKKQSKAEVGPGDVKKAAKELGAGDGNVPLTLAEIRQAVKDVASSKNEFVSAIGKAFKDCFDGGNTPKLLMDELGVIIGAISGQQAASAKPAAVKPATAAKK